MLEDLINLKQRIMNVEEYSLKFSMFSRYVTSLVSNPRDEMSHFYDGCSQFSEGGMSYDNAI